MSARDTSRALFPHPVCSHKKRKRNKHGDGETDNPVEDTDTVKHGGWWRVSSVEQMVGSVAIEFGDQTYVKALDNGLFTLGAPHDEGEGPSPEEVLTAFPVDVSKVALKSGYGKYLRVDKGTVVGRSDAVGPLEQWEPVFQDGRLALSGCNGCFMSVDDEDDGVVARSGTAGRQHFLQMRSPAPKERGQASDVPLEERGSLSQVEVNYVRKFQKFQDKKLKVSSRDQGELEKAQQSGNLHEMLLDRRSKMKSDRYCK
ncbi:protein FRG1 homolog isoform X2 [Bacillus rossius redtenbacheri]|uniref:protein FRG1 homolog isoform X2 n=1 Tax=Bacillus rossius redtenbacheri TaxID=93214 RepID=UPI002FDD82ED